MSGDKYRDLEERINSGKLISKKEKEELEKDYKENFEYLRGLVNKMADAKLIWTLREFLFEEKELIDKAIVQ